MKKAILHTAIIAALGVTALTATSLQAATLNFDAGVKTTTSFTFNGNTYTNTTISGSWFSMDADGSGSVSIGEQTEISQNNGVIVDGLTSQPATGSHSGGVDGSESPGIDNAWEFFTNTGMSATTSPITVLSNDGAGNVQLNFSGWSVTWNGIADIPMGAGGAATMTCTTDCANTDGYILEYATVVPLGDPSGFGGVPYVLHLEGTVSGDLPAVVPVPAAVWLFGSGLLGLVGVARRRKA